MDKLKMQSANIITIDGNAIDTLNDEPAITNIEL